MGRTGSTSGTIAIPGMAASQGGGMLASSTSFAVTRFPSRSIRLLYGWVVDACSLPVGGVPTDKLCPSPMTPFQSQDVWATPPSEGLPLLDAEPEVATEADPEVAPDAAPVVAAVAPDVALPPALE